MNPGSASQSGGLARHLFTSLLVSTAVMLVCFPQMYLWFDFSLIRFQDTEFLYFGLFTLVQNLVHGRFQLWNGYDQMPLAYFYLTGMTTYAHVLSAIVFTATQGLAEDTGRFFYANSVLVFNLIQTVVRTVGIYLMVRMFTTHGVTILLSTALGSSIFNPQFHLGLNCTPIYSLMPLAIFFCLRFLERFRLRDFLLGFLIVTIAVASNPLVGLGYFYQGLHFFLLSALCWAALRYRLALPAGATAGGHPQSPGVVIAAVWKAVQPALARRAYLLLGGALLLSAVIMAPWVGLLLTTYPDYDVAHATSRFANLFTIFGYFERPHFAASPWNFLTKQLDYSSNEWVVQWVFVGWVCVFFTVCGAILSRDSRKYIFLFTILFFWLIQFPRDPFSPFSAAHWLNALTNPFNSVLRSAHMTGAFLLPTMMIPLFAMGIDRVRAYLTDPAEQPDRNRITAILLVVALIIAVAVGAMRPWRTGVPMAPVLYIAALGVLGAAILRSTLHRDRWGTTVRWCAVIGFGLMLACDIWASRQYFAQMARQMRFMTHEIEGIPAPVSPVGLDFQNPLLTPVREHYANIAIGQVKPFFITDPNNMQGIFYRYTNLTKFFNPPSNYKPRHRSYSVLAGDPALQEYVRRDSRISYVADGAVRYEKGIVRTILDSGLDRRVIAIDSDSVPRLKSATDLLRIAGSALVEAPQHLSLRFSLADAQVTGSDRAALRRYRIDMPADFPTALASGVFTRDRDSIVLRVGDTTLVPAQGWLVRPLQYDLQNIRAGTLQFSLPADTSLAPDTPVELRYRSSSPLNALSASRAEPDRIEFRFTAQRAGWLVLHYPFDPKWRVTLNGAEQATFRANGAFIGFPVQAGENAVFMEYDPGSVLRSLIPLSLVLNLLMMLAAFVLACRSLSSEDAADRATKS